MLVEEAHLPNDDAIDTVNRNIIDLGGSLGSPLPDNDTIHTVNGSIINASGCVLALEPLDRAIGSVNAEGLVDTRCALLGHRSGINGAEQGEAYVENGRWLHVS
ncbi:unnamed protein product [Clonostachys chloroleuca]|uniref:Uncharacterized protein n=1 Tax=Clonostachys chloroleuca TaxID=1926264 RepID=A0AA35LUZ2_9HYPO|nr:unnamed protein product [Clonostachys chloroleuca]